MDIAQLQSLVGRLTDQQLAQEANKPTGIVPMYMIMGEMQNRAKMRKSSPQPVQGYYAGGPVEDTVEEYWPAVIQRESGGDQSAVSDKGAFGRAQLMPDTALEVATGLGDPTLAQRARTDPAVNERLGREYFRQQLNAFDNSPHVALAAYNAGPGRARQWVRRFGMPEAGRESEWTSRIPYRETREYVANITGNPGAATAPSRPQTPLVDSPAGAGAGIRTGDLDRRGMLQDIQELLPDRITPAFESLNEQIRQRQEKYESSNRGRPLMEMGLAMMGAKGPNFFRALGQGGQAALGARDRVEDGRNALMDRLLQSQMGQAVAQGTRDSGIMQALYGRTDAATESMLRAQGLDADRHNAEEDRRQRAAQHAAEMKQREAEQQALIDAADRAAARQDRSRLGPHSDPADVRQRMTEVEVTLRTAWERANPNASDEQKATAYRRHRDDANDIVGRERYGSVEWERMKEEARKAPAPPPAPGQTTAPASKPTLAQRAGEYDLGTPQRRTGNYPNTG